MTFSIAQQKALALAPKVVGPLSMVGSAYTIRSTLEAVSEGSSTTYHRLLLVMSAIEMVCSFWYSLSTWPIPKGTSGVWGATGTTTTCTAQGFFIQLAVAIPIYSGILAIYLLLISRYGWNESRTRAFEPLMHAVPLTIGFGGAIAGIPLKLFNNATIWCWYAPFPLSCKDTVRYGKEANCIRGDNAWIYKYAFAYSHVWFYFFVAFVSMLLVYLTVLRKEKDVDQYQNGGLALRKQSKRVASQSCLYLSAFFIPWFPASIHCLLQTTPGRKGKLHFALAFCTALALPLQGFLNSAVYFQARYIKQQRENDAETDLEEVWKSSQGKRPKTRVLEEVSRMHSVDEETIAKGATNSTRREKATRLKTCCAVNDTQK